MNRNIKKIKSFFVKNSSFISVGLILLFSSYLWINDLTNTREDLNLRSQSLSSELSINLQNAVNHRIESLNNIGDLWLNTDDPDDLYNHSRYLEFIAPYFQLSGGFFAINWINTDSIIRWVYPEEENQAAINKNVSILADGVYNYALNDSINNLSFNRTSLINLFQEEYGFATYFPLVYKGNLTGLFNGVFALNNLFDTLINGSHKITELSDYSVTIVQNQSYVYSYSENFTIEDSYVIRSEIDLLGIKLQLFIRPNPNLRASVSIIHNFQIIVLGVSLSCIVGILAYSLQKQYYLVQSTIKEKRKIEEVLFVKQKMESLGTLAGGITHDFNNILAGIRGNIELLLINLNEIQSQNHDPTINLSLNDCFDSLNEIQSLIDRSIRLNRQITEFSKNPTYNFNILNVNSTIKDSLNSFSKMIDQRISLKTDFFKDKLYILGDKARFNQLLLNLLINARDAILQKNFSESAKAEITIITKIIPKELSLGTKKEIKFQFEKNQIKLNREFNIEICVQDTGIGISSENLDKIFDPFFTTKDKARGTGLGLTIVYNVTQFMDGAIKIDSKEGIGTKIRIFFPLILNISIDKKLIQNKILNTKKISFQNLNQTKILVIEDELLINDSLTQYLKNSDAKVISTQNGNDGYELFKKNYRELDLVILDINLPGLNGVELYYKIKEILPKISILFITGYSEYKIPEPDKYDLGILIKPFSLNDIAQKLDLFFLIKRKLLRNRYFFPTSLTYFTMPLSAILWDLDGTLIHFNIDYKKARSETIRILEKYGYPKGQLTQNYYVLKMIKQATEFFLQEKIYNADKITEIKLEIDKKVELIEREASYLARSIPGVNNVLEFCAKRKIRSGIITLNTTKNAILSLKTANLINFFPNTSFIVGRDKVNKNKPDPEHVMFLMNRLNVSPNNICVIGDHPSDIESARSIGARSIAIISEKHPANEFKTSFFVDQSKIESEMIEILNNFIIN